ncbi:hypothetical protein NKI61_30590 [Mesorhizobium sp. M0514]|uniref:glycine betaine ABC transporter substrate-binding protein n=1 Tax=Mesorhizobium sp. M0514 TaxID=2956955 RepID=UPI0033364AB7
MIDKKTADAHGIKVIEQFADPAIVKLFDADGSGKAALYGCDPGWGCERVIEHQLDAYNLRKTVKHKQGSYTAIIGDAIERINSAFKGSLQSGSDCRTNRQLAGALPARRTEDAISAATADLKRMRSQRLYD